MIDWGLVLFFLPGVPAFLVAYPAFLIGLGRRWPDTPHGYQDYVVAVVFASICAIAWFVAIPVAALTVCAHLIYKKCQNA